MVTQDPTTVEIGAPQPERHAPPRLSGPGAWLWVVSNLVLTAYLSGPAIIIPFVLFEGFDNFDQLWRTFTYFVASPVLAPYAYPPLLLTLYFFYAALLAVAVFVWPRSSRTWVMVVCAGIGGALSMLLTVLALEVPDVQHDLGFFMLYGPPWIAVLKNAVAAMLATLILLKIRERYLRRRANRVAWGHERLRDDHC